MSLSLRFLKGPQTTAGRAQLARWLLVAYNAVVVFGLLFVWYLYATGWSGIADLTRLPAIRVGFHAVWFAILGCCAVSFKGITDHWRPEEWTRGRWGLWYLSRPFNGVIVGAVVYAALQTANTSSPPSTATVSIAAFILGTQEKRFYTFVGALAKVFLSVPGGETTRFGVEDITPVKASVGATAIVSGSGFVKGTVVSIGHAPLDDLQMSKNGMTIAGKIPPGKGVVDVVVVLANGQAQVMKGAFTYGP